MTLNVDYCQGAKIEIPMKYWFDLAVSFTFIVVGGCMAPGGIPCSGRGSIQGKTRESTRLCCDRHRRRIWKISKNSIDTNTASKLTVTLHRVEYVVWPFFIDNFQMTEIGELIIN